MRILLVHGRYRSTAPSGENRVVDQEAAALSDTGHEVDRFERHSDEIAQWSAYEKAALPFRSVRNSTIRNQLADTLAHSRPDVVHVHNTFPILSPSVLDACHDAEVPVVATMHNYKLLCASGDFFRNGRLCHECISGTVAPALMHGCYRNSRAATLPVAAGLKLNRSRWRSLVSAYIFISHAQRQLMSSLALPAERVFVKHNLVPPVPNRGAAERQHVVVYLGRLDAAKGVPLLMRSWDRFRAANPNSRLRLVIAGGGPLATEVQRWSESHDTVDAVGMLGAAEIADLMPRALAAIIPSQWAETFGLVAVEAMAAEVAPIAPARGSFPELITDGVDGALFEPDSPDALARTLGEVDRQPERYIERGRRALTTFRARFHPTVNVAELLAIYRYAVENPVRRTRSDSAGR